MTKKLYLDNSFQTEFEAQVERSFAKEERYGVILDETCFYPSSGGQPFDVGFLDAFDVVEVTEAGDEIIHWLCKPFERKGKVKGVINWQHRFDHMQQHTGQHILSAAFIESLSPSNRRGPIGETVSFHLGEEYCTIDIVRNPLSRDEAMIAENLANQVIWENRPVKVLYPTPEELQKIPLRKDPAVKDQIRVIAIDDFDFSPCGGTHVSHAGEVGLIKIKRWEKVKGDLTRIEFVCGLRALKTFQNQNMLINSLAGLFSSGMEQVQSNVEKLKMENKVLRKEVKGYQDVLVPYEVREITSQAIKIGSINFIFKQFENRDGVYLRNLALALTEQDNTVLVFVLKSEGNSLIVSVSRNVKLRSDVLVRTCTGIFGGKGGGNQNLAQASLGTWEADGILEITQQFISTISSDPS